MIQKSIRSHLINSLLLVTISIVFVFVVLFAHFYTNNLERQLEDLLTKATKLSTKSLEVAIWDIDIDYINNFVESLFLYDEIVYAAVVSEEKTYHSDKRKLKKKSHPAYSEVDFSFFQTSKDFITSATPVLHNNKKIGMVELAISREKVRTVRFLTVFSVIGLTLLLAGAVVFTVAIISKRHIFKPLEELKEVTTKISKGNLDCSLHINSRDEIGSLAVNIENMRSAIKELIDKLRQSDELAEAYHSLEKERQKAQQYLDVAGVMLVALNSSGEITLINRQGCKLLQTPETEALGQNWFDHYLPKKMVAEVKGIFNRLMAGEIAPAEYYENPIVTKNGEERFIAFHNSLLTDETGKISGVLCSGEDITERKRAEEEKERLEGQLRQSHKMEAIGTMAGGIAHDFNNILTAVLGYAEMAKEDIPDLSPAKYKIDQVLKAGNRAKDLVHHILTFSRMSSLKKGQISLAPLVKEVLKFQRSIIPTTITIRSDLDENCGKINGDSTQIYQVVMNLCSNASHAMEEEGGTLTISLHETELSAKDLRTETALPPGTYIRLSVRDTGTGLSHELIDRIFDPYFTTKEVGKGSGMGLAVVQGIVKNHGGFVKVESELGRSSTFNVFFPRIEETIPSETSYETGKVSTGTERILFVDDEEMLADLGKATLKKLGYSVTTTTDSSEALALFQNDPNQFDLVITDQSMPNISGAELSKQLLQIRPDIPIILSTGYSSTIDEVKSQQIGIREYTMKPVDKNVIAKLIRQVLDGY